MVETTEGSQPVEVRGEFTVSQPAGHPRRHADRRGTGGQSRPDPAGARQPLHLAADHRRGIAARRVTRFHHPPASAEEERDRLRPALRPLLRGLRSRRRLPALAGQDDHRVRRPPLLHDHHEPPPAAHQRVVRRARDRAGQERRRRQPRVLARARDERPRREWFVYRQPRGGVAGAPPPDVPRRHHLRRDAGCSRPRRPSRRRPWHRHGGDEGLQPARRGGVLLPPQAHGVEAGLAPARRRPYGDDVWD